MLASSRVAVRPRRREEAAMKTVVGVFDACNESEPAGRVHIDTRRERSATGSDGEALPRPEPLA
jgi:hypothetical protein